jgi:hypothetical protein
MKRTTSSLFHAPRLALAMSSLFALPVLAADPAAVVPDESIAYAEMDTQAFYKLKDHPVVKILPLAKLEELMLKLSKSTPEENEKIKKRMADEMGLSYEELVKKFGRFAMTFHDIQIPANPTPETVGGEVSMAAEIDGDEAFAEKYIKVTLKIMAEQMEKQGKASGSPDVEELIKKLEEVMEHTTAEHAGAKIHVWKLKPSDDTAKVPKALHEWAYAFQDKMLVFSSGQDGVEEMLDRLKGGGNTGSLAASTLYKKDHEKSGPSVALASLNLEAVLGLVEKHALPLAAGSDVDVKKIWTALGADKLQSAVLAVGGAAETLDLVGLVTYSEKPGLFTIPSIPGSGTAPGFLPATVAAATYGQVDLDKSFENLTKIAGEVDSRAGAAIQMGLGMVQAQAGVDIRKDILEQLGPDYWTAQSVADKTASPGGAENPGTAMMAMMGKTIVGFRVKDRKAFSLALDTILNKAGGKDALFESREYQGFTINNVKQSPEQFRVGYVLTDDWFILSLGGGELLEQILTRLGKGSDDGFFASKTVAKTLDGLRSGQAFTAVTNLGEALGSTFSMLDMIMKQSGGAQELPLDELAKLLNVPLLSVDKAYIDGTHMEYRMRVVPKGE